MMDSEGVEGALSSDAEQTTPGYSPPSLYMLLGSRHDFLNEVNLKCAVCISIYGYLI